MCKAGSWDKYYFNPLQCPLPKAPSMKLYCMYGVGIPTERAYSYINMEDPEVSRSRQADQKGPRSFRSCRITGCRCASLQ